MLLTGFATPEGTGRVRARFDDGALQAFYRQAYQLWTGSIGVGTYLGDPTPQADEQYRSAIVRALQLGSNVLDTAVNYRHMRSERVIGQALAALVTSGAIQRDEIILATKGGFLAFDGRLTQDPSEYFRAHLVETGVLRPEEVVAGCHAISPSYLKHQIDTSRANLGVETIDIYYLHNPETQLQEISRPELYARLRAAFSAFEQAVADGKIRMYGTATWNAYRVPPDSPEHLSLEDILNVAAEVGGREHHFRAVQLPFNLAMPEALTANTQLLGGKRVPFLHLARERGLMVFASASLLQGQLARGLPEEFQARFAGLHTDAQRALQFVRSTPGITCALVGMSRVEHVEENLATAAAPPLNLPEYKKLFQS